MAAEYERTSEIPVRLTIGGSAAHVPTTTMVGLYLILQHRLSDIFQSSGATEVEISLDMASDKISLSISDDGVQTSPGQLDSIRELAGDMRGELEIARAVDGKTNLLLDVPIEDCRGSLDQPRDSR